MSEREMVIAVVVLAGGVAAALVIRWYCRRQQTLAEALRAEKLLTQTWQQYNTLVEQQEADKRRIDEIDAEDTHALVNQGEQSRELLAKAPSVPSSSSSSSLFRAVMPRSPEYTSVGLAELMSQYPVAKRDDDARRIEQVMMQRRNHHDEVKDYAAALFGQSKETLEAHIKDNQALKAYVAPSTTAARRS